MNYLIHCFLSNVSEEALVANLFGDFVKGRLENSGYTGEFLKGLKLHRIIDSFADKHPAVHCSRKRLSSAFRRFAGIIIDIYYDHLLAINWTDYAALPLEQYAQSIYQAIKKYRDFLPLHSDWLAEAMIRDDWLTKYREPQMVRRTLQRFSGYLPYANPIAEVLPELQKNSRELESDFRQFLTDIQKFLGNLYYTP